MLAKDLTQKSVEELKTLAAELSAQLRDARFKIVTRQFTKVSGVKVLKLNLARVKTVIRQLAPRA